MTEKKSNGQQVLKDGQVAGEILAGKVL